METITFILGLIMGLILPLILEKYNKNEISTKPETEDSQENTSGIQAVKQYTPDLIEEWQTGIIKGGDNNE